MRRLTTIFLSIFILATAANAAEVHASWTDAPEQQAWKGERINGRASFTSSSDVKAAKLRASSLRSTSGKISSKAVSLHFITDVIGDKFVSRYNQCGARVPSDTTMIVVADRLGNEKSMKVAGNKPQDIWVAVNVPQDAVPGIYKGHVDIRTGLFRKTRLDYSFEVVDELLPEPSEWAFHLNLWQNPFSVARYHGDELWSKEHFDHMRPVMERLRDAGQKAITTSIIERPWDGQTQDPFETMITKTRNEDGTWSYDYTVFDNWVEFMMDLGIDGQIDCFSIVPWHMNFDYIDGATGESKVIHTDPKSEEFADYWSNLVKDFASHLREKGWFEKTLIAMDERGYDDMKAAMDLVHSVEPDFKFSLAGWYNESYAQDFDYLCISSTQEFPEDVRAERKSKGMVSTYYVCCAERYPNTFIASDPDQATWIGWYAFAHHFDGFLRWAYNSWTLDPLDARFREWTAGDCYLVYPDCSSVRFEKLIEGIQDYEKATILSKRWAENGETEKIEALDEAMKSFVIKALADHPADEDLAKAKEAITIK